MLPLLHVLIMISVAQSTVMMPDRNSTISDYYTSRYRKSQPANLSLRQSGTLLDATLTVSMNTTGDYQQVLGKAESQHCDDEVRFTQNKRGRRKRSRRKRKGVNNLSQLRLEHIKKSTKNHLMIDAERESVVILKEVMHKKDVLKKTTENTALQQEEFSVSSVQAHPAVRQVTDTSEDISDSLENDPRMQAVARNSIFECRTFETSGEEKSISVTTGQNAATKSYNKAQNSSKSTYCIAVMKYRPNGPLKKQIEELLKDKSETVVLDGNTGSARERVNISTSYPSKNIHPFFLSDRKSISNKNIETNLRDTGTYASLKSDKGSTLECAVTPGKLRNHRQNHLKDIGTSKSLHKNGCIVSQAHRIHDRFCHSFPSKDMAHVRGFDAAAPSIHPAIRTRRSKSPMNRKMKDSHLLVSNKDDIISKISQVLRLQFKINNVTCQGGYNATRMNRIPHRQVTTGVELLDSIMAKLRTPIIVDVKYNHPRTDTPANMHPALVKLCKGIEGTLSPFDEYKSETLTWGSKYQPTNAVEVLQSGNEVIILREWLRNMIISSIDKGKGPNKQVTACRGQSPGPKIRRGKKRKSETLDVFITSSDDEPEIKRKPYHVLYNRVVNTSTNHLKPFYSCEKSSISSKENQKLSNAILISGPPGCGKTAAVYAVAEELGFSIFELNPGSRRSGRDILGKVGDMTENHLVQKVSNNIQPGSSEGTLDNTTEEHLQTEDSRQQIPLGSFFKPKSRNNSKKSKKSTREAFSKVSTQPKFIEEPQAQKQSLILLEEADILFEEDKQFWPTVMSVLAHSKRPIIITCNNEKMIPFDLLHLQTTLRFSSPQRDLAIDYLLLLAAKEGHQLSRESISSLYDMANHDLRKSIMILNFWCQMGVGDKKGGLDWIINRWPVGVDLDQKGRKLRVTSLETYQEGLNYISSDLLSIQHTAIVERDFEILQDICNGCDIDVLDIPFEDFGYRNHGGFCPNKVSFAMENLQSIDLANFGKMIDALSCADLYGQEVNNLKNIASCIHH